MNLYKNRFASVASIKRAVRLSRTGPPFPHFFLSLLYASLVLVVALLSFEVVHYLRVTDWGNLDDFSIAWLGYHPQCTTDPGPGLDLTCPLPGYNTVKLQCWSAACTYRDPNDSPMTEATSTLRDRELKQDMRDSHRVEPPIPPAELAVFTSEDSLPPPPQTMNAALDYMHYRDMLQMHLFARSLEAAYANR